MPGTVKYQPLIDHLKTAVGDEFTMTIKEIEAVVGPLSKHAQQRSFWANTTKYQGRPSWVVQRDSGFDTFFQQDPVKVRFKRRKP